MMFPRVKVYYADRKPVIVMKADETQLNLFIAQLEKNKLEGKSHFEKIERIAPKKA